MAVPEKDFALNPDIQVTSRTPPTFLLQAEDDPVDPVENSLVYYSALRKAGVPAEMHLSCQLQKKQIKVSKKARPCSV